MSTQDSTRSPKLEQLEETYEIIGELTGRTDARTFMGKRRGDGGDVLIVVFTTPAGDEGNALSHLAADVTQLASARQRNLLSIVEGRWIGTDAFAIVMERRDAPTLAELLSRREEEFGLQRIAAILRDTNGVLEWARSQKIVHRAVTPKTLYLEPGSDRVLISFAITALPSSGAPGAEADGRSIADLARAMLTRSPAAPERDEQPLAELRPSLPAALLEETEQLLHPERAAEKPDVNNYIARIAMADALKDGETYLAKTHNAIEEQQRVHREQLEKERRDHEQQLATERKEHERQVAEQTRRFQKESEEFERELAKEKKQLAKEREALAKERAAHARDREALVEERAAHDRDRAALIQERLTHEQLTREQRERLAAEAAALEEEAQRYAQTTELQVPIAAEREALAGEAAAGAVSTAKSAEVSKPVAKPSRPVRITTRSSASRAWWNREVPTVPVVAAALVLVVAIAAIAFQRHRTAPAPALATHQVPASVVIDSASGAVFSSVVPLPDSATAAAAADSARLSRARRIAAAARRAAMSAGEVSVSPSRGGFEQHLEGSKPDTATTVTTVTPRPKPDSAVKQTNTAKQDSTKPDSVAKPVAPPKRDTVPKADTLPKRDTTTFERRKGVSPRRL